MGDRESCAERENPGRTKQLVGVVAQNRQGHDCEYRGTAERDRGLGPLSGWHEGGESPGYDDCKYSLNPVISVNIYLADSFSSGEPFEYFGFEFKFIWICYFPEAMEAL